ncbi:hypothetical protein AAFP30_15180 [Gordonia sp. CPCC 205515]|uniref:hypothetical protein n=1 Tax=Gordonia sp. CPCC 205515 TaxID=3140791 RepID=UPI003AF35B6D
MAELDHDDRAEVTDTGTTDTGATDTTEVRDRQPVETARTPVRSAPLGRGRRSKPTSPDAVTTAAEEDPTVDVRTDDVPTEDVPTEVDSTEAAGADARDPSDVEKTLTYRDRRRARAAAPESAVAQASEVRYAGRRGASAKWLIAGVVGIVLIIACVAASVAFAVGISRQERLNDLRAEYSAFASQMIVNLTTLNPGNVDQAMKTMETKTSGRAQQQMQDSMRQAVGLVQDQKVDTKSTIISNAVTKATPDEGTVILVSGWQMKSPDAKQDTIVQTFRWRVQLTRINGDLKMTNFEWVT